VQSFIEAARTVRDLWTGSALLSWLTFRAMLPVVEGLGPTAVVFSALRGLPLVDTWLRGEAGVRDVQESDASRRRAPCVPNTFLAVAPHGDGDGESLGLVRRCEEAARGRASALPVGAEADLGLSLGSDGSGRSPWLGRVHTVAVYGRALSPEEAARNFRCEED